MVTHAGELKVHTVMAFGTPPPAGPFQRRLGVRRSGTIGIEQIPFRREFSMPDRWRVGKLVHQIELTDRAARLVGAWVVNRKILRDNAGVEQGLGDPAGHGFDVSADQKAFVVLLGKGLGKYQEFFHALGDAIYPGVVFGAP